jgi:hypothetical protein
MQGFRVISTNDKGDEFTLEDLERVEAGLARVRELINDPIALMERAQALLEGWAEPLI